MDPVLNIEKVGFFIFKELRSSKHEK
jgi:hypothetical protein